LSRHVLTRRSTSIEDSSRIDDRYGRRSSVSPCSILR
jgi:hypothetical protein